MDTETWIRKHEYENMDYYYNIDTETWILEHGYRNMESYYENMDMKT